MGVVNVLLDCEPVTGVWSLLIDMVTPNSCCNLDIFHLPNKKKTVHVKAHEQSCLVYPYTECDTINYVTTHSLFTTLPHLPQPLVLIKGGMGNEEMGNEEMGE
jgi:hypothetical protein